MSSDMPTLAWIRITDTLTGIQIVCDWEEVEPVGTLTVEDRHDGFGWIDDTDIRTLPPGTYLIVEADDE